MVAYKSTDEVLAHVRLVFSNCRAFNARGSEIWCVRGAARPPPRAPPTPRPLTKLPSPLFLPRCCHGCRCRNACARVEAAFLALWAQAGLPLEKAPPASPVTSPGAPPAAALPL